MKKTVKVLCLVFSVLLLLGSAACGAGDTETTAAPATSAQPTEEAGTTVLVAYFSCTGNTKALAEYVAVITGGDIFEIAPAVPYTDDDLDYNNKSCRAAAEMNDETARPEIKELLESVDKYDTVFLAYPVWFGQAPKIVRTFLEAYDFTGKTIVPFCTSGSSGVGSSATNLHTCCSERTSWLAGTRFSAQTNATEMLEWVNGLGLVYETN